MDIQQTDKEYLASLRKRVDDMEPLERICSTVIITLGRCVAELLNRCDYAPIQEMEKVIVDIFKEARIAKDQMKDIMQ